MSETVQLWRAQVAQYADGTPSGFGSAFERISKGRAEPKLEPLEQLESRIRESGLPDKNAQKWGFVDLLDRRMDLRANPDLYRDKEIGKVQGFFATSDRETACEYASRYGASSSILVQFEVPLSKLIVDCRDFLDRMFIFGEAFLRKNQTHHFDAMRDCLVDSWGPAVLDYFDALGGENPASVLVNAAAYDERVVRAHLENRAVLSARGNQYRNQFAVLTSVPPEKLIVIESADERHLVPEVDLHTYIFPGSDD